MYAFANRDVSVGVQFRIRGDYVIPDEGTVTYTVYDSSGEAYADLTNQSGPDGSSVGSIEVPASKNTLEGDVGFRWVIVRWKKEGLSYQDTYHYALIPFAPVAVTPERVRSLLGVNETEVLDSEVDAIEAYLSLNETLRTALSFGGRTTWIVNEILARRVALNLMPTLQLRVAAVLKTQNSEFQRLRAIDFRKLEASLMSDIDTLEAEVTGIASVTPVFGVGSNRTDPITGA